MRFIDLRSDTVTEPTEKMLDAMRAAEVGDDVYEDDPTVKCLEEKAARMLGKQGALFVPSGTFANQLAIMTSTQKGDEILMGQDNHILVHEVGAAAALSSVQIRTVKDEYGFVDICDMQKVFRQDDIHHPKTTLICMENAHGLGKVVPLSNMKEVYGFAVDRGVFLHLDGARIFNAASTLKVEPKEIAQYCHSLMFCLSKGLCCPVGSILVSDQAFIDRARKNRKLMGGGMRQAGYLAACGLVALEEMTERIAEDHENARYLAEKIRETKGFEVFTHRLESNMVFCRPAGGRRLDDAALLAYLFENSIKIHPLYDGEYRFVTHYWIDKEKIDFFVAHLKRFIAGKRPFLS